MGCGATRGGDLQVDEIEERKVKDDGVQRLQPRSRYAAEPTDDDAPGDELAAKASKGGASSAGGGAGAKKKEKET